MRIDSALGEVPPAIFGEEVRLEFAARVRLGRRQRAAAIAKAARAADATERAVTRRSRRANRASTAQASRRLRSPETREGYVRRSMRSTASAACVRRAVPTRALMPRRRVQSSYLRGGAGRGRGEGRGRPQGWAGRGRGDWAIRFLSLVKWTAWGVRAGSEGASGEQKTKTRKHVKRRGSGEGWTRAFLLVPGQSQLLIYFSQREYRVYLTFYTRLTQTRHSRWTGAHLEKS